jgi:hypothetical protein
MQKRRSHNNLTLALIDAGIDPYELAFYISVALSPRLYKPRNLREAIRYKLATVQAERIVTLFPGSTVR